MKKWPINILLIVIGLLVVQLTNGQDDVFVIDVSPSENLIVIDDLTAGQLRAEILKIENEFYRVFNANVVNEDLKIECSEYTPTGSHIKRRACEPKFYRDARNENVRNWQNTVDELASPQELRSLLGEEFEELTFAMNDVLKDSEYFRELNSILRMLKERQEEL